MQSGATIIANRAALCYYKVEQELLQSGAGIRKLDNFIKKWVKYYKVGELLQSRPVQNQVKIPNLTTVPPLRKRFRNYSNFENYLIFKHYFFEALKHITYLWYKRL